MNDLLEAEFRTAARALLASPSLSVDDGEAFAAARKHKPDLTKFFADELGYRLESSRTRAIRLSKVVGPGHVARGLRTRTGRRFDARRYTVLCLALAVLEVEGERTTAARLFTEVAGRAGDIAAFGFSTEESADRRTFIQAVQAAEDLHVLDLAEGDEERFARGEEGGDALYRINRDRLAQLLAGTRPPSLASGPDQLTHESYPDTDEGRIRRRRHRVMRALVEQPIVYVSDLTDEDRDYLTSQRARIENLLERRLGLTLEVRAEGWVAVDEDRELTDLRWPDYGSAETSALRICDELRSRRLRSEPGVWPSDEVEAFVDGLGDEYAGYWKQGTTAAALTETAVEILLAARLITRTPDGALVALAGVGRFAATEPVRQARKQNQLSFADDNTGSLE